MDDWEAEMDQRWAKRSSWGGSTFSLDSAGALLLTNSTICKEIQSSKTCFFLVNAQRRGCSLGRARWHLAASELLPAAQNARCQCQVAMTSSGM